MHQIESKAYSVHADHLGTPKAISNDKQEIVWQIDMGYLLFKNNSYFF